MNKQSSKTQSAAETSVRGQTILIVDSSRERARRLEQWLCRAGYRPSTAMEEDDIPALVRGRAIELVILDSKFEGGEWAAIVSQIRGIENRTPPILLITHGSEIDWTKIIEGLAIHESGSGNDFIAEPFGQEQLLAKIQICLRLGMLQHELRVANSMLKELTEYLDNLVEAKVSELENVNRLRRFFSPQIVEAIISQSRNVLKEHRGEITVVFIDLRRFTPFDERHSPQEVIHLVRAFHKTVGPIIFKYGGTLERFTGDGMMVFLGDPNPLPDHPYEAVCMAVSIQREVAAKRSKWTDKGYELGLGIGIATGEAIMGTIGFEKRSDYAAIGTVTNLAARLCGRADNDQILLSQATYERCADRIEAEYHGSFPLKGFSKPTEIYAIEALEPTYRDLAT